MSRPQRSLRKIFTIYCEGDTEYHYINHMRKNQGVELSLKPINMKGGGYLKMAANGYRFFESANHVWLTKEVPVRYLRKL